MLIEMKYRNKKVPKNTRRLLHIQELPCCSVLAARLGLYVLDTGKHTPKRQTVYASPKCVL